MYEKVKYKVPARPLTIVAVGDYSSRKTELLIKYTYNKRNYKYYMPSRFETNIQDIIVDHRPYDVQFVDAETDDDYLIQRTETYQKAHCIILCYSIANRKTFDNLAKKWCPEVRRIAPYTPIVLVGTDTEARADKSKKSTKCLSFREGENFKSAIRAYALVECSVEKCVGIDDVFIEAVRSTRLSF